MHNTFCTKTLYIPVKLFKELLKKMGIRRVIITYADTFHEKTLSSCTTCKELCNPTVDFKKHSDVDLF